MRNKKLITFALLVALSSKLDAEELKLKRAPGNGKVLSVEILESSPPSAPGTPIGEPLIRAAAENLTSTELGDNLAPLNLTNEFLNKHSAIFGVKSQDLQLKKEEKDKLGMTHLRFKQRYKGIDVYGAELISHVKADAQLNSKLSSVSGSVAEAVVTSANAKLKKGHAARLAKKIFKQNNQETGVVRSAKLTIIKPAFLKSASAQKVGTTSSYLVWQVEVSAKHGIADETYFIDARSRDLRYRQNNNRELNRKIYDCSAKLGNPCYSNLTVQSTDPQFGWLSPPGPEQFTFGCKEDTCPRTEVPNPRYPSEESYETYRLFDYMGSVHNYYQTKFQRNGANGIGGNVNGTEPNTTADMDVAWGYINWLPNNATCVNAISSKAKGVSFCKGTVHLDIVGHEYAHSDHPQMLYEGESGALEESHSDVMGEMIEFDVNGSNDWVQGGEVFAAAGIFRNLANPNSVVRTNELYTTYPDRYTSPDTYCGIGSYDADMARVHQNSTIVSKAYYLASVGGSFNGCTINAIGREKAEQINHRSMQVYYSNTENFNGAYFKMIQSCIDLYGAGSTECREFTKALQAVELDQVGYCSDTSLSQKHPSTCSCEDNDDWQAEGYFSEQAFTKSTALVNGTSAQDYCASSKILVEQFCDRGSLRQAQISCPGRCVAGACVN